MRVVIFLIYLCSLVLRGYDYIYINAHHNPYYTPIQHSDKRPQAKFANINQDDSAVRDAGANEEEEYLISDDRDDEDANNELARKYKLLVSRYLTPSYTLILSSLYTNNSFKDRLSFGNLLSNKYIIQRVLRI